MRQPKYRRLYALALPLVVAGSVAAWLGMWYEILRSVIRSSLYSAVSIERFDTSRKVVALTFDVGSAAGYTEQILDTLSDNGVRASFGVTGEWAEKHPELLRRVVREKHTIINHTYSHRSFTGRNARKRAALSYQGRANELWKTESVLQSIAGASSKPYFRPPYGDYDTSVLADIYACGYKYNIMWSVDSGGWRGLTKEEILQRVLKGLEPGAIYCFHVAQSQDGPALGAIISTLRERGYGFVTIDDFYRRGLPAGAFQPNGVAEQPSQGSPEAFGRLVRHARGPISR